MFLFMVYTYPRQGLGKERGSMRVQGWFRCIAAALLFFFTSASVQVAYAGELMLTPPGEAVGLSAKYTPCLLKGVRYYPSDPFRLDFVVEPGDSGLSGSSLKDESTKLVKYFLATLTTPANDLWVNLSPYEGERIIPDYFGQTEMGRDLLAQDYLLKQLSSSLLNPDTALGKAFWARVYARAGQAQADMGAALETFNKVWILPDSADITVRNGTAMIVRSHLKLMLDNDYLAATNRSGSAQVDSRSADFMREIVLPELEKEVNAGANFALVRQAYSALILATWLKRKILKDGASMGGYLDGNKVVGIDHGNSQAALYIWEQYVLAFKKGAVNLIREERDEVSGEMIPRKYFSGGVDYTKAVPREVNDALLTADKAQVVTVRMEQQKLKAPGMDAAQKTVIIDKNNEALVVDALLKALQGHYEQLEAVRQRTVQSGTVSESDRRIIKDQINDMLIQLRQEADLTQIQLTRANLRADVLRDSVKKLMKDHQIDLPMEQDDALAWLNAVVFNSNVHKLLAKDHPVLKLLEGRMDQSIANRVAIEESLPQLCPRMPRFETEFLSALQLTLSQINFMTDDQGNKYSIELDLPNVTGSMLTTVGFLEMAPDMLPIEQVLGAFLRANQRLQQAIDMLRDLQTRNRVTLRLSDQQRYVIDVRPPVKQELKRTGPGLTEDKAQEGGIAFQADQLKLNEDAVSIAQPSLKLSSILSAGGEFAGYKPVVIHVQPVSDLRAYLNSK